MTLPRKRRRSTEAGHLRKFLIIVDGTAECDRAIYYSSRRAQSTGGRVVMIAVTPPPETSWRGVEELMRAEARDEAQKALDAAAARARAVSGVEPERVIREGDPAEAILSLIADDEDIAIFVLAAGTGREGPGPLVSMLAGRVAGTFPIPVTIVPGDLTDEEIDALA
jgi:nucleotide-binding universal stress UspA family protein